MIVVANAPYDEPAGLIGDAGRIRNGRDESADAIRLPVINLEFDVGQLMTEGCQFVNQGNETIGIVHLGGPNRGAKVAKFTCDFPASPDFGPGLVLFVNNHRRKRFSN
jgi:hypothetical protein